MFVFRRHCWILICWRHRVKRVTCWTIQRLNKPCQSKCGLAKERKSRALSIYEKNPEISVVAKVEFPIGKKLFHLVVNPGTWRCPTEDLELVQTTRNVNGTRHSVRKFQPGKRDHLFRFSTSGNFPVGRTDETCSIYRRTGNSGNFG